MHRAVEKICNAEERDCDCPVDTLLRTPFKAMKLTEKYRVIKLGRPKLKLNFVQAELHGKEKRIFTRNFRMQFYDSVPWLCGCRRKNRLFCWPCLLFSRDETIWNTVGYDDLKNFGRMTKLHQMSANHLISLKERKQFWRELKRNSSGKNDLKETEKKELEHHNLKAGKERIIFKKCIPVVNVLVKLGFTFSDSDKRILADRLHMEVFKLLAHHDSDIKSLTIEENKSFNFELKHVALAISKSLLSEIKREISETQFVALILDGVAGSKSYLSTSLRYIKKNGELVERFLHFTEWSKMPGSALVFRHISQILEEFNCASKFVAYSYDGAVLKVGEHADLKELVRRTFRRPVFIHSGGHGLSYIFKQALNNIPAVNFFFTSLVTLEKFFSKTELSEALENEIRKNSPNMDFSLSWHDHTQLIKIILNYQNVMIGVLSKIGSNQDQYSAETVCSASNLLVLIRDLDFNFLLHTFSPIFTRCDVLSQILQFKMDDPVNCRLKIDEFESFLEDMENNFDGIWQNLSENGWSECYSVRFNDLANSNEADLKLFYKTLFSEIFDVLIAMVSERFADVQKQIFPNLLNHTMFKKYHSQFPKKRMTCLADNFYKMIHHDNLINELVAIYSDPEFRSVFDLYGYLKYQELIDVFPETCKLCQLMLTLPMVTKSKSISDRIRNFVLSGRDLNEMSSFWIESELLNQLVEVEDFLDKVVNQFAELADRKDLLYKVLNKTEDQASSVPMGLDPNLFAPTTSSSTVVSAPSTVVEMNRAGHITLHHSGPHSEAGPSTRLQPDTSMNNNLTVTMTCEKFPVGDHHSQITDIKIKEEPSDFLSVTVEQELNPSDSMDVSMFQSPALIKEEIVSFEEDL